MLMRATLLGSLFISFFMFNPTTGLATDDPVTHTTDTVQVIKKPIAIDSVQELPYFVGISNQTVGAKSLSMRLVIIPPGASAQPHIHRGYESAVYVLEGSVKTHYGENLEQSVVIEAGDFLYIPPDVPHQPVNLDPDRPARAIVVRSDANEQENVIPYTRER